MDADSIWVASTKDCGLRGRVTREREKLIQSDVNLRSRAIFWAISGLFVVTGVVVWFLSERMFAVVAPVVHVVQFGLLVLALRRNPAGDRRAWMCMAAGIVILIFNTSAVLNGQTASRSPLLTVLCVTSIVAETGFFAAGAFCCFRPLLKIGHLARMVKVGMGGFVLSSVAIEWFRFGSNDMHGWGGVTAMAIAAVGAVLLAVSVWTVVPYLRLVGRNTEAVWAIASGTFAAGQLFGLFASGPSPSSGHLFAHSIMATGIVCASAFRHDMLLVGRPLGNVNIGSIKSLPTTTPIVIVLSDGLLAWLAFVAKRGGPTIVAEMALVVVGQLFAIVWLSGRLVTLSEHFGVRSELRMKRSLRTAISRGDIRAHYQPIVDAASHVLVGFETLARWDHPVKGLLPAAEFIPLAEAHGMLGCIDLQMIRAAARSFPTLRAVAGHKDFFVTVNVGPARMQDASFASSVLADLDGSALTPVGLIIELTETAAVLDREALRANVAAFQAAGVGFAIDDFGSGHANFGLLVELDPDIVKLDQSLVASVFSSVRGGLIARNVLQAVRCTGARIVAEGISDPQWATTLRDMGVDYLQGYAFGKPTTLEVHRAVEGRALPIES